MLINYATAFVIKLLCRVEVLAVMIVKSFMFRDITPCTPLEVNRRFGDTFSLYLLDRRISQGIDQHE
jgi:hypothetical protein